jgi:hypothetical protein
MQTHQKVPILDVLVRVVSAVGNVVVVGTVAVIVVAVIVVVISLLIYQNE